MTGIATAVLIAFLELLGKPGFWYCATALLCAAAIGRGIKDAAASIGVAMIHVARGQPGYIRGDRSGEDFEGSELSRRSAAQREYDGLQRE